MKIKTKIRKVHGQPFTNVSISIEKSEGEIAKGSTKFVDKQFIVKSTSKSVVKGEIAKFLRNITQKAEVVEFV